MEVAGSLDLAASSITPSPIRPFDTLTNIDQSSCMSSRPSAVEPISPTDIPHSTGDAAVASDQIYGSERDTTAQTGPRTNRFSLTFPIRRTSIETSPIRSQIATDVIGPDGLSAVTGPSDGNFLTAIAAQERRVLEIKEDLHKAEAELTSLKLQWASHEAQKKKQEAKKTTRLRPLSTSLPPSDQDDVTGSNAWLQQEMERRRSLISGTRSSSRRVFSGSKHTRALSLLAPAQATSSQTTPLNRPRGATSPVKEMSRPDGTVLRTQVLPRTAGTITTTTTPNPSADDATDLSAIDKDLLLKTGKKMAMDLKDGIWTFWEDLRQVTVGEDIVQVPSHQALRTPRRGGSRGATRGSSRGSSNGRASLDLRKVTRSPIEVRRSPERKPDELLLPHEATSSTTRSVPVTVKHSSKHSKTPSVAVSAASSDAFDAWDDSPKASCSSSATSEDTSRPSPSSIDTSPALKADKVAREPIPWPNLAKLGPATLRRTASHLMSEWEKLNPPVKEDNPSKDYLAAGDVLVLDHNKKQD